MYVHADGQLQEGQAGPKRTDGAGSPSPSPTSFSPSPFRQLHWPQSASSCQPASAPPKQTRTTSPAPHTKLNVNVTLCSSGATAQSDQLPLSHQKRSAISHQLSACQLQRLRLRPPPLQLHNSIFVFILRICHSLARSPTPSLTPSLTPSMATHGNTPKSKNNPPSFSSLFLSLFLPLCTPWIG